MLKLAPSITFNQYPQKINYITRVLRSIFSNAHTFLGIASTNKPQGLSVMMRIKDEADWITASLESIMAIADEIVIVDNGSTDGTFKIIQEIASLHRGLIRIFNKPDLRQCDLSNFALEQTTFKWAFRWDGDMVAVTSGRNDISGLRERIFSLDNRRFYIIYLKLINLAGDLFHQDPTEMVHVEEYIHTYSTKARYIHPGRYEAVKFPKYYKPLFWYEPYSFHVNVKPGKRMLLRYFWEDWMEQKQYQKFPTLEDYVNERIESEFGTNSWKEAQTLCVQKVCHNFIRYNPEILSPYPELLLPYLENMKYRLKYKNGKIVGRDEA